MGTTLDAMKAGSTSRVWVVAIEGYPWLLTNATPAAAVTAWSGSDWSQALPGLFVELDNEQTLDPWQPFQGGGSCTIKVVPKSNSVVDDQFGIDLNRVITTPETQITATVDRAAPTIFVQNTSGFDAAGEAYLGNECFFYSSKTSSSFVVFQRGRYWPFKPGATGATGATTWAEHHRAGFVDATTPVHPLVTKVRRTWVGAWVAVYAHRVVNGVLDTRDQAQLVFAGQIADHVDDASTGAAVVHLTNVLDVIRDTTLLRDQFRANLEDGVYVAAGQQFSWWDQGGEGHYTDIPRQTANNLVVVASGASGPNQINTGFYDALDLRHILNTWLSAEITAGRLNAAFYSFEIQSVTDDQSTTSRLVLNSQLLKADFGLSGPEDHVEWLYDFTMPYLVAAFLGLEDLSFAGVAGEQFDSGITSQLSDEENFSQQVFGGNVYRIIFGSSGSSSTNIPAQIGSSSGILFDQYTQLPSTYAPFAAASSGFGWTWGFFLVNDKNLILGALDGAAIKATWQLTQNEDDSLHYGDDGDITLTQIAGLSFPTWTKLLQQVFRGSGTANYNDDAADILPFGLGLGLPASLAPDPALLASIVGQDGADLASILWIREPTKLAALLTVDFVLRGLHLVWRNGGLTFVQWHSPSALDAGVYALDETNKSEPAGNRSNQKATRALATEWAHPVVQLKFDYDPVSNDFLSSRGLEDSVAIDDANGISDPMKLECKTMSPAAVQQILPGFMSRWIPYMTRPLPKLTRSIAPTLYEGYAPGDTALLSDDFARDPSSGTRGVNGQPVLVSRHRASHGGLQPGGGKPAAAQGEVDVIFAPPGASRIAQYSPAAEVDNTASSSGFSAGYNSSTPALRFKPHEHSRSPGGHDVDSFNAGDKVRILEVDPDDPSSPLTWTRTIVSHAGDDAVLNTALSSPSWNAAKRYRMVPDHYLACQATQQAKAFEADDTTALIESNSAPDQYALASGTITTFVSHTVLAERHAALADGDGKPRDTGFDAALARTLNNLYDHKTAHQTPALDLTERSKGGGSVGTYRLTHVRRVFFGTGTLGLVTRAIAVAPFMRSLTGASANVRVTLARTRPTSSSYVDVAFTGTYVQSTFATTSTTYVTAAEALLSLAVLDADGSAWLCVECGGNAATRGLAQCIERERT